MIKTMKRDKLMNNFYLVKVILTSWRVFFEKYFLNCVSYCSYDIIMTSTTKIFLAQQKNE